MPRLVYVTSARRDLAKIAIDIERASQSRETALKFAEKLTEYCEHIARLSVMVGRDMEAFFRRTYGDESGAEKG